MTVKNGKKTLQENTLPIAIAIELDTTDYGVIRRQFLVAGDSQQEKDDGNGKT